MRQTIPHEKTQALTTATSSKNQPADEQNVVFYRVLDSERAGHQAESDQKRSAADTISPRDNRDDEW